MFCVFINARYANEKLMHIGNNFLSENLDVNILSGFISLRAYHITPNKGLGVMCFDSQKNLEKNMIPLKEIFSDYEDRFNCKITIDTGIENRDLWLDL